METNPEILSYSQRRYEEIPVDQIKVINSRNRDQKQFDMNVESIETVGLLKPIRVNDRFLERTGFYELICGEGRLIAHQKLGRQKVPAEVITCSRKEAYLQSLVENIARTKPDTMDFARELKRLRDEGWSNKEIAAVACKNEGFIRDYIRLVERGEDRLIHGVESGIFPIKFATQVAFSEDTQLQNILMDAFDEGLVTTNNFSMARHILTTRARTTKSKTVPEDYTVTQMRQDISDATKAKTSFVREAKSKENRFMILFDGVKNLWQDKNFVELVKGEKLDTRPELAGDFSYVK
jgi:ParB family chromosome partitioning protein